MRFLTVGFASLVAFAVAGAMTFGTAQAMTAPGIPAVGKTAEVVKGEKKKKEGPGRCGTLKYWDKKTKSCADATTKK